ncbi:hypothetical protein OIU80_10695 [Flavobacterium sp. LS1R47]|uniref:Lipoprotein n=1 Tax=Flavobacterium frigoritolerans TaxID=2987686 RepID=A0A9X2ZQA2_9FLAO|nr:hypothetical protein [Flavobacterium frigoritolerans]MCV9932751.1 hypothetical protein [Flavobacterium frigoritolerans]
MKKILIYFVTNLLLISCQSKDPILVKQIISNEMVTIKPDYQNLLTKDSVPITIPIEFEITQNSSNLKSFDLYFILINNKRLLDDISDYQVYGIQNKTKSIYFSVDSEQLSSQKTFKIIVKIRRQMISRKDAEELLKKYNINQSLDYLKPKDTIKLTTSNRFRKENSSIINNLNKINDSIVFSVLLEGGKKKAIKEKINW